jgi:hypothetical protein
VIDRHGFRCEFGVWSLGFGVWGLGFDAGKITGTYRQVKRITIPMVNGKCNKKIINFICLIKTPIIKTVLKMNTVNNARIYKLKFSSVYPLYVQKAEKKGRTKAEVDTVICWLTGYNQKTLQQQIDKQSDFETFFKEAPQLNPNVSKITGLICGYRVEEIEDPLVQKARYMDKLIDELAKGRKMEKILRE